MLDIFRDISEIFRHIKQSTKKALTRRLLGLEFKSNDIIKSKAIKFIAESNIACLEVTMEAYCISCKKYTTNENSSVRKTKENSLILLSNCAVCGKEKSSFIENKELHNFND